MNNIAIFGAGGFGREVKMLIDQINTRQQLYNFVGYFDDGEAVGTVINNFPVLGGMDELNSYQGQLNIVLAIGHPQTKKKILSKISKRDVLYPVLIHPNVFIGTDDVNIGEGSIICGGCMITVNIKIGRHVILNLGCTVGHDTFVHDYCSFMPSVNISGEVNIDEGVYVGTGAKIINRLEIGANTIIGAGAVVSKTLPADCTAVGIPAKAIKFHNQNVNNES